MIDIYKMLSKSYLSNAGVKICVSFRFLYYEVKQVDFLHRDVFIYSPMHMLFSLRLKKRIISY